MQELNTPAKSTLPSSAGPRREVTPTAASMVVFDAVTKVYEPDVRALRDVSFVIDKGEFVFIVGASGSGKSTIIRLLIKEREPTRGRISWAGATWRDSSARGCRCCAASVACVFQRLQAAPQPHRVRERRLRAQGAWEDRDEIRRTVPEVLALVGLSHKASSYPVSCPAASSSACRLRALSRTTRLRQAREPRPGHRSGSCSSSTASTGRHDNPHGHARPGDGVRCASA